MPTFPDNSETKSPKKLYSVFCSVAAGLYGMWKYKTKEYAKQQILSN